jgi:hypothetical protein
MSETKLRWALPGVVFCSVFALSAACGSQGPGDVGAPDCPKDTGTKTTTTTGAGTTGSGGTTAAATGAATTGVTTGSTGSGMQNEVYDPPQALEINTRLHSCRKLRYSTLYRFLSKRGVALPAPFGADDFNSPATVFGQQTTVGALFGGSNKPCLQNVPQCLAGQIIQGRNFGCTQADQCSGTEVCYCDAANVGTLNLFGTDQQNAVARAASPITNCQQAISNLDFPNPARGYCVATVQANNAATAAYLYFTGKDAFEVPRMDSPFPEKDEHTVSSSLKAMDIFIEAAPEVIANIGSPVKAPACSLNGVNKPMFSPQDGTCVYESVSCLVGRPASDDHMLLCNLILQKANPNDPADVLRKQRIAVATMLTGANLCE